MVLDVSLSSRGNSSVRSRQKCLDKADTRMKLAKQIRELSHVRRHRDETVVIPETQKVIKEFCELGARDMRRGGTVTIDLDKPGHQLKGKIELIYKQEDKQWRKEKPEAHVVLRHLGPQHKDKFPTHTDAIDKVEMTFDTKGEMTQWRKETNMRRIPGMPFPQYYDIINLPSVETREAGEIQKTDYYYANQCIVDMHVGRGPIIGHPGGRTAQSADEQRLRGEHRKALETATARRNKLSKATLGLLVRPAAVAKTGGKKIPFYSEKVVQAYYPSIFKKLEALHAISERKDLTTRVETRHGMNIETKEKAVVEFYPDGYGIKGPPIIKVRYTGPKSDQDQFGTGATDSTTFDVSADGKVTGWLTSTSKSWSDASTTNNDPQWGIAAKCAEALALELKIPQKKIK